MFAAFIIIDYWKPEMYLMNDIDSCFCESMMPIKIKFTFVMQIIRKM
jgi:hypothetical protein